MKTTGIIRRIDELGRIVIPKEIRKNLRIKNGESLEIYLENDSIILIAATGPLKKKYLDKEINEFTERSIERRDNFFEKQKKSFQIINDEEEVGYYTFSSIVDNGDAIGSVILISTDVPISDVEDKMCIVLSKLLSKQFVD